MNFEHSDSGIEAYIGRNYEFSEWSSEEVSTNTNNNTSALYEYSDWSSDEATLIGGTTNSQHIDSSEEKDDSSESSIDTSNVKECEDETPPENEEKDVSSENSMENAESSQESTEENSNVKESIQSSPQELSDTEEHQKLLLKDENIAQSNEENSSLEKPIEDAETIALPLTADEILSLPESAEPETEEKQEAEEPEENPTLSIEIPASSPENSNLPESTHYPDTSDVESEPPLNINDPDTSDVESDPKPVETTAPIDLSPSQNLPTTAGPAVSKLPHTQETLNAITENWSLDAILAYENIAGTSVLHPSLIRLLKVTRNDYFFTAFQLEKMWTYADVQRMNRLKKGQVVELLLAMTYVWKHMVKLVWERDQNKADVISRRKKHIVLKTIKLLESDVDAVAEGLIFSFGQNVLKKEDFMYLFCPKNGEKTPKTRSRRLVANLSVKKPTRVKVERKKIVLADTNTRAMVKERGVFRSYCSPFYSFWGVYKR